MSKKTNSGLSFFSILTLIFITLKLTGYITWSWFWVLSPMFLPLIIVGGLIIGLAGIAWILKRFERKIK